MLLVAAVVTMVAIGVLSLGFFAIYGFYLVMIVVPFVVLLRVIELALYYRSRAQLSPYAVRTSRLTVFDLFVFVTVVLVLVLAIEDPGLYPRMIADVPEFISMIEF